MPLAEDDQRRVNEAENEAAMAGSKKILVRDPTESQKLSGLRCSAGDTGDGCLRFRGYFPLQLNHNGACNEIVQRAFLLVK